MSSGSRTARIIALSDITNILGMLGIIGSLIFVGIEIQQSQTIAIASQLQSRNDALMTFYSTPLEGNDTALKLFEGGLIPDIDWSNDSERTVFLAITRVRIISYLNAYNQYRLGLIPDDTFEFTKNRAMVFYDDCRTRPLIVQRVTADFASFLEDNSIVECSDA
jgi:hypothetical protein|tara:strand:+ start:723 stop:1214 length:492 start_codon:yes stop_codon:yes gene_type:complete